MAIKLDDFADDFGTPDAARPDGFYLDEGGGDPGTSIKADGKNQIYYFFSKLMDSVSLAFSGTVDNFTTSQFFTALTTRINNLIAVNVDQGVKVADSPTFADATIAGHAIDSELDTLNGASKGLNQVALTNYTTTIVPAIAANSVVDINGAIYTNSSNVSITGSTSNSTWYDILLTPSGASFTASFIARGTGVWSDSKQGLYSGNNRVIGIVYRDGSGNFINKNILAINNRNVVIKIEIGDWDMVATVTVTVAHGVSSHNNVKSANAFVRDDADNDSYSLERAISGVSQGSIDGVTNTLIALSRFATGFFDDTAFDDTPYNRGWLTITYEV